MMQNRALTVVCLFGALVSFALALIFGSGLLSVIAACMFALTFMLWKYGHLLVPLLTRAARVVEVRGPYMVNETRDALLKQEAGLWYCTRVYEILFLDSVEGKSQGERAAMIEAFERMISSFKYPVKISILIAPQDISAYLDELRTKRSELEERLSHVNDEAERRSIERRIKAIASTIDRLSEGEQPVDVVAFVATTALGTTKEDAEIQARRQGRELKTVISSTLNAEVRELKDLDLVRALEFEAFLPVDREALADEVF